MLKKLNSLYLQRKVRITLHQLASLNVKKAAKLSKEQKEHLQLLAKNLQSAQEAGDEAAMQKQLKNARLYIEQASKKSSFDHLKELSSALLVAAVFAILIRSMWFEIYQIPSGSMRPSFRELDNLTVSKTQFGLNVPLATSHFSFDPNLVERAKIVIFSGDGIDLPDTDTNYFWLFPGKKRYIKRLIAKPGDTLYFYGGKIYALDKEGNPIEELLQDPYMEKLDHIPFLRFDGRISQTPQGFIFKHFNIPIGKAIFGRVQNKGEIFFNNSWQQENSISFSDLFGIKNYGMTKILSPKFAQKFYPTLFQNASDAPLYLEIAHSPQLTGNSLVFNQEESRYGLLLSPHRTLLPLYEEQIEKVRQGLYTARFDVKDGAAKRYSEEAFSYSSSNPVFPKVPDGRYEYYFGNAYKVLPAGILKLLPKDSPLYPNDPEMLQKLFNMGIDFSTLYSESSPLRRLMPHRYAYFRDGDFYVMGTKIFDKNDPALKKFIELEEKKAASATSFSPYKPFIDHGSPIQNGEWNKELIRTFGVTVPEKQYLVLGDNHAMSADSRYFGFVPQENLQGVPSFIFWPPGERFATSQQTPYPLLTPYRISIWCIAALSFAIFFYAQRKKRKKQLQKILDS